MNLNRVVPYLSRINSCEGTREKPQLLYVTKGGKENSLIFHFKENGKFYQYRANVTVMPNLEGKYVNLLDDLAKLSNFL